MRLILCARNDVCFHPSNGCKPRPRKLWRLVCWVLLLMLSLPKQSLSKHKYRTGASQFSFNMCMHCVRITKVPTIPIPCTSKEAPRCHHPQVQASQNNLHFGKLETPRLIFQILPSREHSICWVSARGLKYTWSASQWWHFASLWYLIVCILFGREWHLMYTFCVSSLGWRWKVRSKYVHICAHTHSHTYVYVCIR